ncbi:MAG: hypothetical protein IJ848_02885 [Alphaproteobacteria bacterium]|nr:hypothetical protein [Alphaproteobacteria bacterium]
MINIRSLLKEHVLLLENANNDNKHNFTYKQYNVCYKSSAYIVPINTLENKNIYEIIIPKPPLKFSYTVFTGIEWNKMEYKFISPLQTYQENFIKSTMENIN